MHAQWLKVDSAHKALGQQSATAVSHLWITGSGLDNTSFFRLWLTFDKQLGVLKLYRDTMVSINATTELNPLRAQLFDSNFHPLEVVSRYRDPQIQGSEN